MATAKQSKNKNLKKELNSCTINQKIYITRWYYDNFELGNVASQIIAFFMYTLIN